jgi:hypothetical protein
MPKQVPSGDRSNDKRAFLTNDLMWSRELSPVSLSNHLFLTRAILRNVGRLVETSLLSPILGRSDDTNCFNFASAALLTGSGSPIHPWCAKCLVFNWTKFLWMMSRSERSRLRHPPDPNSQPSEMLTNRLLDLPRPDERLETASIRWPFGKRNGIWSTELRHSGID